MLHRGMTTEIRWLLFFIFVGSLVGFIVGAVTESIAIALLLHIGWLYRHISHLQNWMESARSRRTPRNTMQGVWAEIADDVIRIKKRHKKDRKRLQSVLNRVRDMASAIKDGVILLDAQDNIEWWNTTAENQFQFEDVDRNHRLTNIVRHPRFVKYFDSREYSEPLELESLRKEGQFLEIQIHPFGQGDNLVVIRDITRVKKLERMRKDFVANVSHELRTPLTVIRGYIETLGDDPNLDSRWHQPLEQMQQQGQRMTALINDLIILSKLETDESEIYQQPVSIHPMVSTIIAEAKALCENRNIEFTQAGAENIVLMGIEKELRSAVSNLVVNAVKYSEDGCKIDVITEVSDDEVKISVKDNGVGIDAKHIPRLTERFYRVDDGRASSTGGTGLGLAIVKHVLLRHDAELVIHSRVGHGSTFNCVFPINRLVSNEKAKLAKIS